MVASVEIAVLMPHAPILVPVVAGKRLADVRDTVDAMREVAQQVLKHQPDALVLISPHSPRRRRSFGVWTPDRHVGSLARFNAPDVSIELPNDPEWIEGLHAAAAECCIDLWKIGNDELDHGAVVPLWFMCEAGWRGPTTILSLNYPGDGGLQALGQAIAGAAAARGGTVAVIASGDMSHRLKPGAPGGYHPGAGQFDEDFIRWVDAGDVERLLHFDSELQEIAGEDVLDSTLVALAAAGHDMRGHRVLGYEGPFGVGYGVAVLHEHGNPDALSQEREAVSLPNVARLSVAAALGICEAVTPEPDAEMSRRRAAVFVTIRTLGGQLRGCVGTLAPRRANVIEEIWFNARAAAFEDTRFNPLRGEELDGLVFEVSILHSFEEVRDASEIDPQAHGVIVSTSDARRGLLLPAIEGVDTSEQQIAIARRKGSIRSDEAVRLQRFAVDKFQEQPSQRNPSS
jgi:AmmeMemoRadiSam system protein A